MNITVEMFSYQSLSLSDPNHIEAVNTLIRGNAKAINNADAKDNEKSQKVNWWINELDSLGMKESNSNDKNNLPCFNGSISY